MRNPELVRGNYLNKRDYLLGCAEEYTLWADSFEKQGNQPLADEYRKWANYCRERAENPK